MSTHIPPVTAGAILAAEVTRFLNSSGMTIDELMLALIPEAQKFALPRPGKKERRYPANRNSGVRSFLTSPGN